MILKTTQLTGRCNMEPSLMVHLYAQEGAPVDGVCRREASSHRRERERGAARQRGGCWFRDE